VSDKETDWIVSHLRDGDSVAVQVGFECRRIRLRWEVTVECNNRQAFPCAWVRGGFSRRRFIGRSHTQESATQRAARVLHMLSVARDTPSPKGQPHVPD
jgi:hypothetical protein